MPFTTAIPDRARSFGRARTRSPSSVRWASRQAGGNRSAKRSGGSHRSFRTLRAFDCLAGAWFEAVNRSVASLNRSDYRSRYTGVFDVSDPRGLPWQNPSAHGTPRQRSGALDIGARKGAKACLRELGPGFSR